MNSRFRITLIAAVTVAFVSGLVFASGFDLTKISWAQARTQQASRPAPAAVKSLDETAQAFEAIAEHVTPAVVSIEAEQLQPRPTTRRNVPPGMEDFFRNFQPDDQPRSGTGSGFIVSKDGYILTNNHVVANADRVTVTLLDNRRFPAKVIGKDPTTDVALIKIEGDNLPMVALGDDEAMRVGQWVVAIGNPLGLDFTVTAGIVSAKGRSRLALPSPNADGSPNRYAIQDFIQTDAAINPGNSGGPLVNIRGEVIGINSAIASSNGFNAGYGFAIPITLARQVMNDLREYGRVRRALLGVQINEVSPTDAKAAGLSEIRGIKIESFEPAETSPAKRAGMEIGDVVITAAGQRVNRVAELQRVVRGFKPGEVIELEAMRFGEKKTFKVRLTEPPAEETVASNSRGVIDEPARDVKSNERLGITVQPVSDEIANDANVRAECRKGVVVTKVSSRGPSYRELFPADVIVGVLHPKKDVRTVSDLEGVAKSVKSGEVLSLVVCSAGGTRVVNLSLEP
jgi:serine protease Do